MKITPIEIRQHTFEKALRGYKTEEVDAFLSSLSQEWERVVGEQKMLKMQLELAEKELNKLKEVELTLFRMLKTAEDTSSQITDQANRAADQHMTDARKKADEMLADARKRSALMIQDAENQSRYLKDSILNDLKAMEHDFKAMERYKDNLAQQIRTLAGNAMDSVDRFEKKFERQSLKGKIDEVADQIKSEQEAYARSQEAAAATATTPQPDNLVDPATTTAPEAASNESIDAGVDEALAHQQQHTYGHEPDITRPAYQTYETEEDIDHLSGQGEEPEEAGLPTVSSVMQYAQETPEPEPEPEPKKEGGSFFDQI
ncbi:DivIVA domain-containing protein [Arsenicibacter rosenii]|uniref:Cell division protein DivIVA n=1 Tax=Arsenicibacter rosenii TaxID=1750698 RepID=A0A1S2VGJ5_9BACT|nr:DivIVA domain-containing protein [Arsenicibacter rosenii]OIN57853.1 cell division protein DivIVA [Arsenicibacter rosenii]